MEIYDAHLQISVFGIMARMGNYYVNQKTPASLQGSYSSLYLTEY